MGNFYKNGRLSSHTQKKLGRHIFQKFYVRHNISNPKKQFSSSKLAFGLGLPPSATAGHNKMIIWRPFIQFSRFELLKFCEFWNWPILPDFTNLNTCFRRNHLRLQWIPYLKIFLIFNYFYKKYFGILCISTIIFSIFQKFFNILFFIISIISSIKKFLLMKFLVFFKNFIVEISKLKLAKAQFISLKIRVQLLNLLAPFARLRRADLLAASPRRELVRGADAKRRAFGA